MVVLPGDKIPVDGVVVEGRSSIDESALTGEALPVIKTQGSSVTAGTMNCDGTVTVRAEQSGQVRWQMRELVLVTRAIIDRTLAARIQAESTPYAIFRVL